MQPELFLETKEAEQEAYFTNQEYILRVAFALPMGEDDGLRLLAVLEPCPEVCVSVDAGPGVGGTMWGGALVLVLRE